MSALLVAWAVAATLFAAALAVSHEHQRRRAAHAEEDLFEANSRLLRFLNTAADSVQFGVTRTAQGYEVHAVPRGHATTVRVELGVVEPAPPLTPVPPSG